MRIQSRSASKSVFGDGAGDDGAVADSAGAGAELPPQEFREKATATNIRTIKLDFRVLGIVVQILVQNKKVRN